MSHVEEEHSLTEELVGRSDLIRKQYRPYVGDSSKPKTGAPVVFGTGLPSPIQAALIELYRKLLPSR